ncbi:hypothetical protein [Dactylosporangium darangshiense]|uniref:hypothetical protein n=1 Tax=Dactylosporangium darangshiense TaxID=579108 RepID=UPI0031F060E0
MTEPRQGYDEYDEPQTPVDGFSPIGPASPVRPGTVTGAAAMLYIGGVAAVALGCVASIVGEGSALGYPLKIAGFVAMIAGIVNMLLARAVLRGRAWARTTAVVLGMLNALSAIVPPLLSDGAGVPQAFFGVALNIVLVGLLLAPTAREYFAASSEQ